MPLFNQEFVGPEGEKGLSHALVNNKKTPFLTFYICNYFCVG